MIIKNKHSHRHTNKGVVQSFWVIKGWEVLISDSEQWSQEHCIVMLPDFNKGERSIHEIVFLYLAVSLKLFRNMYLQ